MTGMSQPFSPDEPRPPIARPWQPRFTILGLMLTTLVVAVAAAAVSYLVKYTDADKRDHFGQLVFLLITLAGPMLLVILVSVARVVAVTLSRSPKRPRKR